MERSKIVAIITGVISLILAIAYLMLVQFLDFRGEMIPAPISQVPFRVELAATYSPVPALVNFPAKSHL